MRTWILILACCALLCFYIGFECGDSFGKKTVIKPKPHIPSIIELQRAVGAKPDGILGPETIRLWDEYCANQYAAEYFTPSGGKE